MWPTAEALETAIPKLLPDVAAEEAGTLTPRELIVPGALAVRSFHFY